MKNFIAVKTQSGEALINVNQIKSVIVKCHGDGTKANPIVYIFFIIVNSDVGLPASIYEITLEQYQEIYNNLTVKPK